ncbi:MAG: phytanoyl-CoA dioxygenase family protein, partial [Gammaproteobacteria bacterium]|nr:phytanoyl-CoA dioxygenase family protein [Gammaproteobacteria bacterium]
MTYALAPDQVNQYQRDGFLFPLDVFDNSRVEEILDQLKHTRTAAREQGLEPELTQLLRTNTHYILPFVSDLATAPQLLDRVESILGPNILLWSAEFFIKGAHTDKIVSWHQDLTYWGLGETNQEMTAWLALSDVNVESGCMRFVPGSHHQQILPHRDTF